MGVASMGRYDYTILIGKPEIQRPVRKPRWEDEMRTGFVRLKIETRVSSDKHNNEPSISAK
jgi:hypothetical protein